MKCLFKGTNNIHEYKFSFPTSSCGGQHANFANDEKEHDPPQNSRRESSRPREEKGA